MEPSYKSSNHSENVIVPKMKSYEDLLDKVRCETEYDVLYEALLDAIKKRTSWSEMYIFVTRLQEFYGHIINTTVLSNLCNTLQIASPDHKTDIPLLVRNVIDSSKHDVKLKKLLETMLRIPTVC
jgi:hypothetical protein